MNLDELLKAAVYDPSRRSTFLQTLIRSDIFVICQNPVQKEADQQNVRMELMTVSDAEGKVFIPFFTSHNGLQRFIRRHADCYRINCLRFFNLIQNMSAVLNPNSYGKEFSSMEIKTILKIAEDLQLKASPNNEFETFSYKKPKADMTYIIKPACKFFSSQQNVERAFIVEMQKGAEKPKLMIVVDMLGNTRKLFVQLADYLEKHTSHTNLYFFSYEQELAKKAVANIEPFYIRNTKRYFQR